MVAALELVRGGADVLVIEKRGYPSYKVCGEYVSNEVRPYLESLGLDLEMLGAVNISTLSVTTPRGTELTQTLDSGGFGLSRFVLDHSLYQLCVAAGVRFLLHTSVAKTEEKAGWTEVYTNYGDCLKARLVIGAYGKRSVLDSRMGRDFTTRPSSYMAVKYHVEFDQPDALIALHNFENGYCGISAVEDGKKCLCYLTHRSNLKKSGGSIPKMEKEILGVNPHLRRIFGTARFCYEKPLVINEISFAPKSSVENGLFMAGDAAGLITPLCGNGMAMAIHSAKILSGLVTRHLKEELTGSELAQLYRRRWQQVFGTRLRVGRMVQGAFGKSAVTEVVISLLRQFPSITGKIIALTHGEDIR